MGKLVSACLSCDIPSGNRSEPGGVLYEDDYWHVGGAAGPAVWTGFVIVRLKRHCEHLAELTPQKCMACNLCRQPDHATALGSAGEPIDTYARFVMHSATQGRRPRRFGQPDS